MKLRCEKGWKKEKKLSRRGLSCYEAGGGGKGGPEGNLRRPAYADVAHRSVWGQQTPLRHPFFIYKTGTKLKILLLMNEGNRGDILQGRCWGQGRPSSPQEQPKSSSRAAMIAQRSSNIDARAFKSGPKPPQNGPGAAGEPSRPRPKLPRPG